MNGFIKNSKKMYLRRILLLTVFLGLLLGGLFAAMVYRAFFSPNTAFEPEMAYVYIPTGATYADLKPQLAPLLEDLSTFESVAEKKRYLSNIKPGRYPIEKGMNNNQIVNSLRSRNTPVKVSFNNQETPALLAGRIAAQIEADSVALYRAFTDTAYLKSRGWTTDQALLPYIPNSAPLPAQKVKPGPFGTGCSGNTRISGRKAGWNRPAGRG